MVNRSDISRRIRAKTLRKINAEKRNNPQKYINKEMTDRSKFLAMDYDYKRGLLPPHKIELYEKLKKEYEENKQ